MLCHRAGRRLDSALSNMTKESRICFLSLGQTEEYFVKFHSGVPSSRDFHPALSIQVQGGHWYTTDEAGTPCM